MTEPEHMTAEAAFEEFDRAAATAEGWDIFNSYRGDEIEADDEAAIFESDDDAEAFVRARAAAGSRNHQLALRVHDLGRAELVSELLQDGFKVEDAPGGGFRSRRPGGQLIRPEEAPFATAEYAWLVCAQFARL